MLPVDAWLNRNAMWLCGSQARNSPPQAGGAPTSPMMPPRISTVRVAPTSWGCGLVHVTLVIAVAHCGHYSASSSTSNTCSGDVQVDGGNEAERCAIDEVRADALALVHGHTR
jgi:hypothetical protein